MCIRDSTHTHTHISSYKFIEKPHTLISTLLQPYSGIAVRGINYLENQYGYNTMLQTKINYHVPIN